MSKSVMEIVAEMSGVKLLELALMLGAIDLAEVQEDVLGYPEEQIEEALRDMGYSP